MPGGRFLGEAEKTEIWDRPGRGEPLYVIAPTDASGTLVELTSRYTMLVALPKTAINPEAVWWRASRIRARVPPRTGAFAR